MKKLCSTVFFAASVFASGATAATTKYMTSFQHKGAAAVEGEIVYEPVDGGKKVKSRATVSFIGKPTAVEKVLDQKWLGMSELAAANIDNCVALGGTLETVTVKAGSFDACKIESVTPEVTITKWTGVVPPAGLLRMDIKKAEVRTREELVELVP